MANIISQTSVPLYVRVFDLKGILFFFSARLFQHLSLKMITLQIEKVQIKFTNKCEIFHKVMVY